MMISRRHSRLSIVALCLLSLAISGFVWSGGTITWDFLLAWTAENYDTVRGIPKVGLAKDTALTNAVFLNTLSTALPEARTNAALASPNYARNLLVQDSANPTVTVTFLHEGAIFKNSIGYYLYDADNPPTSRTENKPIYAQKVLFPNASFYDEGGSLQYGLRSGDTVTIDLSPAHGQTSGGVIGIGFFCISDGFTSSTGVKTNPDSNWVFNSLDVLNPESAANLRAHALLMKFTVDSQPVFVLGMEDFNRGVNSADHDYNDALLGIRVSPVGAVVNDTYNQPILDFAFHDDDGDLVPNELDEYPIDPNLAYNSYYPSKTAKGLVAYEDMWPKLGDFDMNDLVIRHKTVQKLNAKQEIKEVTMTFEFLAKGATNPNGFAVEMTGLPWDTACVPTLVTANGVVTPTQSTKGYLGFRIFNDSNAEMPTPSGSTFVNTVKGEPPVAAKTYVLTVNFTTPVSQSSLKYSAPYNPYIFHTNKVDEEIHLPGYLPTAVAAPQLFGSQDDNTDLIAKRYYVSKKGYPWALNLPEGWKWPIEQTDIVTAYPSLKGWVESSGATNKDWYLSGNSAYTY